MLFFTIDGVYGQSSDDYIVKQINKIKESIEPLGYCEICTYPTRDVSAVVLKPEVKIIPPAPEGKLRLVVFHICPFCHSRMNDNILNKLIIRNYQ